MMFLVEEVLQPSSSNSNENHSIIAARLPCLVSLLHFDGRVSFSILEFPADYKGDSHNHAGHDKAQHDGQADHLPLVQLDFVSYTTMYRKHELQAYSTYKKVKNKIQCCSIDAFVTL